MPYARSEIEKLFGRDPRVGKEFFHARLTIDIFYNAANENRVAQLNRPFPTDLSSDMKVPKSDKVKV